MLNDPRAATSSREDQDQDQDQDQDHDHDEQIRDIHALSPPRPPLPLLLPPPPTPRPRRRETWETSSHRSSSLSMASEGASMENFTSMSREFNALVIAGSSMESNIGIDDDNRNNNLARIGEEGEVLEETNPLAIVPDSNPLPSPRRATTGGGGAVAGSGGNHSEVSVQRVKREEVETKISAWQTAKVAKINNRFKREDAIIGGWESAQVQKATSWMKKAERKLEEKRARALEKMQNDVAKAHMKAEEKRASAEAKRGTKVARVFEIANLMKAVGRAPSKRSIF